MTDKQLQIAVQMFKVAIHADIIEAELLAINPIRNIKDQKMMMIADKLQRVATEYRKEYEKINPEFRDKMGDIIDAIDIEILNQLK
jgi:hypothetical protein